MKRKNKTIMCLIMAISIFTTFSLNDIKINANINTNDYLINDNIQRLPNKKISSINLYSTRYTPQTSCGLTSLLNEMESDTNKNEIIVGILDTGINIDYPYISDRILVDKCKSYIMDRQNPGYKDGVGHGTYVAATVIDATPSNVKIIMYKVFNTDKDSDEEGMVKALQQAYIDGCDVINLSFGSEKNGLEPVLKDEIDFLYQNNIPVVVSAGNEHDVSADTVYPASSDKTITVSAINNTRSNNKYNITSFSSYGNCITFSAPGEDLLLYDGFYNYLVDGTSFSSPLVAAQIANIQSYDNTKTVQEYINTMKKFISDDFDNDYSLDKNYKSIYYGYGYLDFSNITLSNFKNMILNNDIETTTETTTETQTETSTEQITTAIETTEKPIEVTTEKVTEIETPEEIITSENKTEETTPITSTQKETTTQVKTTNPATTKEISTSENITTRKTETTINKESTNNVTSNTINLTKPTIKNTTKTKKSNKIKVSLKKIKTAKKYEIQICQNKSFKKILFSKTFKLCDFTLKSNKFKNKTKLYIKVRCIYTINNKTVKSKWCKYKKIKIK